MQCERLNTGLHKWAPTKPYLQPLDFETGSHYVAQADLEMVILLPQPPHLLESQVCVYTAAQNNLSEHHCPPHREDYTRLGHSCWIRINNQVLVSCVSVGHNFQCL